MNKNLIDISRFLSLVLRHKPESIGVKLDKNGWILVDELINKVNATKKYYNLTKDLLDEIVRTNDKKRFAYSQDGLKIRASQGHSIDINLNLSVKVPPRYLYHGTSESAINSIKNDGLKKMNRNHVHMNENPIMSEKVGARHGKPKVLRIRALDMNNDGIKFYLSENKVWLTDDINAKYIDFDWK